MMKRTEKKRSSLSFLRRLCLAAILVFGLLLSVDVFAASSRNPENTQETLPQGETIEGPGFFGGTFVRIDGTINGTAFLAGQDIEVSGTINGDLFVAGQNIIITGEVTGNIYSAGMTVRMEGQVDQDIFMAGQNLTIVNEAALGRDLFTAGATILQEGQVQRHMYGAGESIIIVGTIGGDANFSVNELTLQEAAVISGNLSYESNQEATIASGATIEGETDFTRVERTRENQTGMMMERSVTSRILGFIWSLLSVLLVWFLVKYWRPTWWERTARPLRERPLASLGIGLAALLLTPFLIILLMITVIGIPLGLILMAVYGILLYLTKIIVAVALAMWVDQRYHWTERRKGGWLVVLALVVLGLLSLVPIVNFIVGLLVVVGGLGAFVLSHYKPRKANPRPVKN